MKLSVIEIVVLAVGVFVVAPLVSAELTPSPDAVTMGWVWLVASAVFAAGFFAVRRLLRRA